MKTGIKICGLRTMDDIGIINNYDVDYAGFVFAKSRRQVTLIEAKEMKKVLAENIKAVGIFVNADADEINEIIKHCNLDIVQLHGDEGPEIVDKINAPVWKSVSVKESFTIENIDIYKKAAGILFDSINAGSGRTFDWQFVRGVSHKYFTILAGGLNSKNVQEAINVIKPHVVDVSSGVEVNGKKDNEKIKEFVRKVREYDNKS